MIRERADFDPENRLFYNFILNRAPSASSLAHLEPLIRPTPCTQSHDVRRGPHGDDAGQIPGQPDNRTRPRPRQRPASMDCAPMTKHGRPSRNHFGVICLLAEDVVPSKNRGIRASDFVRPPLPVRPFQIVAVPQQDLLRASAGRECCDRQAFCGGTESAPAQDDSPATDSGFFPRTLRQQEKPTARVANLNISNL